ncbi:MAG: cytochrome c3 family protein [Desulfobulbaceae bacterium]|nr:cytochrome c3 family protein [Desulfobulbaceae bacterium]
MKKQLMMTGSIFVATVFLGLGSLSVLAAGTLKAPETEVTIEGKKPAHFNHQTHLKMGMTCGTCHHDAEHKPLTAEAIAVLPDAKGLACVSCHNSTFAKQELQKQKDVFHARCKECHKSGYEGKTGPSSCVDCHIQKVKKAVEGC